MPIVVKVYQLIFPFATAISKSLFSTPPSPLLTLSQLCYSNEVIKLLPKNHQLWRGSAPSGDSSARSRRSRRAHPWRRVFALVGALLLVIVIPSVLVVYFHPNKAQASWFDNNWGFRERIPITNSSGTTQTNFQVMLTVDTATLITNSKMLSSCNDLRVTSNVGKLLPYWIEPTTCNTSTTKIWVKVDSIPTTNGEIYIYYGNPSASAPGNNRTTDVFIRDMQSAAATWPLDDSTSTQSYSRVQNPAVSPGRNILLNGTPTSATSWTLNTGWSYANNLFTHTPGNSATITQTGLPLVSGKFYRLTFTVSGMTAGQITAFATRTANGTYVEYSNTLSTTLTFTPSSAFDGSISNISLVQMNIPASGGTATQLLTDGDMEASGTSAWQALNSTISKDTNSPHGGTQSLKVAYNGTIPYARQFVLNSGSIYRVRGYMRSDGTAVPIVYVNNHSTTVFTGTTSTSWQPFDAVFIVPSGQDLDLGTNTSTPGTYVEYDDVTLTADTNVRPDSILSTVDGDMEVAPTTGTATSGSSTTLTDSSKNFTVNGLTGQLLTITSGTGANQSRTIVSNTATVITTAAWTVNPDNTSVYQIIPYWNLGSAPAISKDNSAPHGGTYALKVAYNGVTNSSTNQVGILITGKKYRFTGWFKGDGTAIPSVTTTTGTTIATGTSSTSWQSFDATFIADNTGLALHNTSASGAVEFDDFALTELDPMVGLPANGVSFPTAAGGHLTNAYSFDGTNDVVNIYSSDLNSAFNPNEGTALVWFKVSGAGVWTDGLQRFLIRLSDGVANTVLIEKYSTNNTIRSQYLANGTVVTADATYSGTGWTQVVLTWSISNNQVKVYVNGSQSGSTLTGLGSPWNGNLSSTLAAIGAGGSSGTAVWSGLINDVHLYPRALSAAEISDLYGNGTVDRQAYYTENFTGHELIAQTSTSVTVGSAATEETATGPTLWWKFDDGTGTSAKDSSSNANTGTLGGTTIPTWQTEDQCISGKCLFFDGASSKVTGSKVSAVQSIAFWVRPNTIATQGLLNLDGGTHKISTNGSGVISATGFTSPTYYINGVATTTPTLVQNQWNYVEITTGTSFNTTSSFTVGTDGTNFIKGFFDEVKFYAYARTQAQVNADFLIGQTKIGGSSSTSNNQSQFLSQGLVGYWKMDEASWNGTSGEVKDSSGNANNGKAVGLNRVSTGSNTSTTLNDTSVTWPVNSFTNSAITIVSGTGSGQTRVISSNTTNQYTVSTAWGTIPDSTSHYILTPYPEAGKFGNGGLFSGNEGYVDVGNSSLLNPSTALSLSFWFKSATTTPTGQLVSRYTQGGPDIGSYAVDFQAGGAIRMYFTNSNGSGFFGGVTSTTGITDTNWHHVVTTYSAGTVSLYIDGKLNRSVNNGGPSTLASSSLDTLIGARNAPTGSSLLAGTMDEVRIYNRALSAQEVSQLYTFAPGPVGWWKFDDHSGTSVLDSSGFGNTGTWIGTTTNIWTTGKYGSAGNFNQGTSNNQVNISDATSLDMTSAITLSAWVYPTATFTGNERIIQKNESTAYDLEFSSAGGVLRPSLFIGGTLVRCSSTTTVPLLTWTYLTATYDGSNFRVYLNGILSNTCGGSGTIGTNTTTLVLGNAAGGTFHGLIDDVRIYNYARTQSQIQQDMQGSTNAITNSGGSTNTSQPAAPLAYWKFDEGFGTTANNNGSGGSALNGTLTNMASPATSTSGWQVAASNCKINKCLSFDGTNDFVNIYSTALSNAFNPKEGSLTAWVKVSGAGVWTDGTNREVIRLLADNNNFVFIDKDTANNALRFEYGAGGTFSLVNPSGLSNTGWMHVVLTWSKSNDQVKAYINGAQVGSTVTGLGTWVGSLGTISTAIGAANTSGSVPWSGQIDEVKVFPYALTADQIAYDYNLGSAVNYGTGTVEAANFPSGAGSATGLVGDWEFEEKTGTTVNDSSGQGNTGTWNGTGTSHWTEGKYGEAGNFNGTNDYVTIPTSSSLSPTTAITLQGWVKTAKGTNQYIMTKNDDSFYLAVGVQTANKADCFLNNVNSGWLEGTTNLNDNNWHYVVCTYDKVNEKIYVDGRQENTVALNTNISTGTNNVDIGRRVGLSQYLTGSIDQVRIYNYARSADQIAYDYNRGAPVARWKMDECQGTTINDASGNGNTGTLTVGASGTQTAAGTCNTSGTAWGNGATGKYNASLNFDGTDDYVNVPTFALPTTRTFSAWIYPTSVPNPGTDVIFAKRTGMTNGTGTLVEWFFYINNGKLLGHLWQTDFVAFDVFGATTITPNTWHHVVLEYDGSTIKVYLDGKLDGTTSASFTVQAGGTPYHFGDDGTSNRFFPGKMDDIRIYNYALTQTQVNLLYNNGSAVNYNPVTGSP